MAKPFYNDPIYFMQGAFSGIKSKTVTFGPNVRTIGESAFLGSDLHSVYLPDNVQEVGKFAFANCHSIEFVRLSPHLSKIEEGVFQDCKQLKAITIPDGITEVSGGAFCGCESLTAFEGKFASRDGRCLVVNGELIAFAPAGLTEYSIPDGVSQVGEFAFACCHNLKKVFVPDSVSVIKRGAFFLTPLSSIRLPKRISFYDRWSGLMRDVQVL